MKVTQIHELLNEITKEVLGSELVNEDLTNLVDVGNEIINTDNVDNYVKKLVDRIGKVEFDAQKYKGNAKSVLMDNWEYGSVMQRIDSELPIASENDTWLLENGKDYNPNIFYQPKINSKFFDSKVTFEIPVSFAEKQVKSSFTDKNQMNGFLSMLVNNVENSLTIKLDSLIMRTINNFIGNVINSKDTNISVNLLEKYNKLNGTTLKAENCLTDKEFLKYSNYIIKTYINRISKISTLFNVGKRERFTNVENANLILLTDYVNSTDIFLQSELYHNEFTDLKNYETVPYWQGCGNNYDFKDISKIDVKVDTGDKKGVTVSQGGIIGVLFDTKAVGVTNLDKRVTTNYNAKAEFYTNFYKTDSGYFNDFNQNFIVFYVADTVSSGK